MRKEKDVTGKRTVCAPASGKPQKPSSPGVGGLTIYHLQASRCLTSVIVRAALPIKKAVGRADAVPVVIPQVLRRECT